MNLAGTVNAVGQINKAWAGAIAAPLADWLVDVLNSALTTSFSQPIPESAQMALTALIVGLVVYKVPNLKAPE